MNWTRIFWLLIIFTALRLLLYALGASDALTWMIVLLLAVPIGYAVEFRTRNS